MDAQTLVPQALPIEAERVLSRWEQCRDWFLMNRAPLGRLLAAVGTIVAGTTFAYHLEVATILASIAALIGTNLVSAGASHGDKHFADKVNAVVSSRSGGFQAVKYGRRADDTGRV